MKRGSIVIILAVVLLSPFVLAEVDKNIITGEVVFSQNPNDLQRIYSESLPAITKINVYYDYEVFVPKLESISFGYYFDYEYPSYDQLNVDLNKNINGFENFFGDTLWEEYKLGDFYYIDEFGYSYIYEITNEDKILAKEGFSKAHKNEYPFIGGTGFFVDPKGYILTNAHVTTLLNSELESIKEEIKFMNYLSYYYELYDNANYNELVSIETYDEILQKMLFLEENLEIRNLRIKKIEIIWGEGSEVEKYEAVLIDSNERYLDEIGGRDWALLKIDGQNFPALPLGDSGSISLGEDTIVIGYPWTSEGYSEDLENYVAPTPTYGKVSNIVPSGKYKDVQIDVSIEEGNSGGPGLNSNGEVIGIATSGYSSLGGSYNYLTPINDVKSEINFRFKQSEVDTLWKESLTNFWGENYLIAKEKIGELDSLSPNHPYAEGFLNQINKLPNTNKEIVPEKKDFSKVGPVTPLSTKILIFVGIIIISLLMVIIFKMSQKKKR